MSELDFRARAALDEGVQVIAFSIGGELHGCDILLVSEVVSRLPVHPLPDMPPHLLGVVRLRGELVPVLDVARALDLRLEAGRAPAVLVTGEEGARVGVAADAVSDVMTVPPGAFRPAPRGGGYLVGVARVGEQLVNLIDLAEILRDQATLSHGEKP
ncbi:MAG TPA: chemotaxis protein CheW [Longimicrobium sp.]|nr:chemotaxis protein CheW [Longimicrobium sp.]